MADANDSNSFGKPCGFKSHLRYMNNLDEITCDVHVTVRIE